MLRDVPADARCHILASICHMRLVANVLRLKGNPRSTAIRAVAKANNLDLEEVETDLANPPQELLNANPLKKVPTFVGADGYVLTESIAIAIYGTLNNT
ncbi:hypothetical protein BT67DRAFT_14960 [Trichocladium antarcticum]|uniref:GST N-terminal domain-containing protein n=1 Tax=Trichocladium antarcticum TaxID=1450529 RepID=A0AAN6UT64_9PEZI|nr:hypothetical protein BT67DRAFT_14960 [Trichocladium antarcticum]